MKTDSWSIADSIDCYNVDNWGKGYFHIGDSGTVTVHPDKQPDSSIDLYQLVCQLERRGIKLPILIRFSDILKHRVKAIADAFQNAQKEFGYSGAYSCVYPIKVNQQRHVVEEILAFGAEHNFGLEAGSKPELLAVLALTERHDVPIVCNGFKDDEFIETVILAQKLGRNVIPIVEKFSELELIAKYADEHDVRPKLGVRIKLASRGAGRWESSAGYRSKFGLTVMEVLKALEYLKEREMQDCMKLLHFHMGSQVTNIRNIKSAMTEIGRVYVELKKNGAGLEYLDVGGGLGIDYDGSQSNFESSVNYTLQEYANDIVFRLKTVCDEAGIDHPTIISESGRAIVSYHSVLIFDVLGVSRFDEAPLSKEIDPDAPKVVKDLFWTAQNINKKNYIESYHDTVQLREEALNLFNLGYLDIFWRAQIESLYWISCTRLLRIIRGMDYVPDELENLESLLADTYFCNYSVFQSMPDSWAIKQLFPILPIHRLAEEPSRRGILADITCDSDGKVDRFIDLHDVKNVLELHPFNGERYYLGAFLVGAYQEILGDLHNLFGDTNAVHVRLDENDEVVIEHVVKGDTVSQVLSYVQYSADELLAAMRRDVEKAVRSNRLTIEESARFLRFYEEGLAGYTYLER